MWHMNCVDVSGQSHTLAALLPGKEALVPTDVGGWVGVSQSGLL